MALTSVIRFVRALDTASTTGGGKTGLTHSDITAKFVQPGGTLTSLTTETVTTLGTYQSPTSSAHIRIKELSSSDPAKGVYEVHLHDGTISSGSHIIIMLSATGAAFVPLEFDLANVTGRIPTALTSNGNIKSSLLEIITTALTEGATGRLATAWQKAWNVASSTWTSASINQGADNNTILASGTYGLSALKTLIDAISTKTTNLPSDPADASEIATQLTAILNAINAANYAQTRFRFSIPEGVEVPESGTAAYVLGINTYNASGVLTDLDSTPSLSAYYVDGTSAAALFGSVTRSDTGLYSVTLSLAAGTAANKFVRVVGTGAMSGDSLGMTDYVWIRNDISPDFSSTDRTKLEAIHGKLPSKSYLAGTSNSDGDIQLDEATGTVARVTLVDTCTTNTDMRGTNNAATQASLNTLADVVDTVAADVASIAAAEGTGVVDVTITVEDSNSNPVQAAVVELRINASRYSATTNASGVAVINPTEGNGTYTVRISAQGYSLVPTPATLVVSGDTSHTYTLTTITIPSSDPDRITGFLYTYDSAGAVEESVMITLTQTATAEATGISYDTTPRVEYSDADGLVTFVGMFPGARYEIRRGSSTATKKVFKVPIDATSPFELPSLLGNP